MAAHTTILSQLLKILSRREFEAVAQRHHRGRGLRSMTRWSQFLALMVGQLSGRSSLRDVVANFNVQASKLYHLGAQAITRTSFARVNEQQPASLFEELFHKLLARTQAQAPGHRFRFNGRLFSLDASLIELTATLFPWAKYQKTKGAIKIHVGLDHGGYLPTFLTVTEGREHEIKWARGLDLPAGSVVVFDRGFYDYEFFNQLSRKKIRFVTRLKRDIPFTIVESRKVRPGTGVRSDETIRLTSQKALALGLVLRRIGYQGPETGKHYYFLTNAMDLAARTIADVYRERWQIELFFKWIKQNLRIKTFLGTSTNAVLTQLWVAMCAYLLVAYTRFMSATGWSMRQILHLLQLSLFERRDLAELLKPPERRPPDPSTQMLLQIR